MALLSYGVQDATFETVFNQRLQLGLIHCHSVKGETPAKVQIDDERPEYILLLVDHDPESKTLITPVARLIPLGNDVGQRFGNPSTSVGFKVQVSASKLDASQSNLP